MGFHYGYILWVNVYHIIYSKGILINRKKKKKKRESNNRVSIGIIEYKDIIQVFLL